MAAETKFKVGDRVRRTGYSMWPREYGEVGKEYTVLQVDRAGNPIVIQGANGASPSDFELVTETWRPKLGDRVTANGNTNVNVEKHWNENFRKANGEIIDGALVVASVADHSGGNVGLSNKAGRSFFFMPANTLKPAAPVVAQAQPAADAGGGFTAGDRIRLVKSPLRNMPVGTEVVAVARTSGHASSVHFNDEDGVTWRPGNYFELVNSSLKIEAGKFYKTRDGRKVGPMEYAREGWFYVKGSLGAWRPDGRHDDGETERRFGDLVAEWVDEPKASNDNGLLSSLIGKTVTVQVKTPAQPKFKIGDRVRPSHGLSKSTATVTQVIGNQISVKWNDGAIGSTNGWTAGELDLVTTPTIVALIENGQPKPSAVPHVHATEADAAKEAARLAGKHKGQQFGVFILTTTSQEAAPTYRYEWQRLAAKGEKIAAIKELRSITGLGLKATKDAVEHWVANDEPHSRVAA